MQKNVLILGASGDIGSAIASQLVKDYHLILHYNSNQSRMEELVSRLPNDRILQTVRADLTNIDESHELCASVHYAVDAIVFVSGMTQFGLFQEVEEMDMDDMIQLHIKAPWLITQYFLPDMIRNRSGEIVFITSIWGNVGASNEVMYSSVKGAQNSFVRALAKEVGPSGVSVNAVSPGFIETKMNGHLQMEEVEDIISEIPLNRAGKATDIAHAVQFLLDDKSNYIQGEIININGGW